MLNISFDFVEKLKISTIDLLDTRNTSVKFQFGKSLGIMSKQN